MSDTETSMEQNPQDGLETIRKRRSAVFQRRSLPANQLEGKKIVQNAEKIEDQNNENSGKLKREKNISDVMLNGLKTDEESFDISSYIQQLKDERKTWKQTLKQRKIRLKNVEEEKKLQHVAASNNDLLSDADKEFFLRRPRYEQISKKIPVLSEVATKVAELNVEVNKLHSTLTFKLKEIVSDTTKHIIELSEADS